MRGFLALAGPIVLAAAPVHGTGPDLAVFQQSMAAAERALQAGRLEEAADSYRSGTTAGWLLLGGIDAAEGRLPAAEGSFRRASATGDPRALRSLALVQMQAGDPAAAAETFADLVARDPTDMAARRLRADALAAAGRPEDALREMETARTAAPDDLEVHFALGRAHLRLRKPEEAAAILARVAAARPQPQTHVLLGRTYRDFGEYQRARKELRAALALDRRVRRAHYYLGTVALLEAGSAGLDEAIAEFRAELALAPGDPLVNLNLGMALIEARREAEALPALDLALAADPPPPQVHYYIGRSYVALGRPAEAVAPLRRALEAAGSAGATEGQLGLIHYQLALALRQAGKVDEAAPHFAEAERFSAESAAALRDRLDRYLKGEPETEAAAAAMAIEGAAELAKLSPAQRTALHRAVAEGVARAHLNLGVIDGRAGRLAAAAEEMDRAAAADPDFPRLQASLGIARFNLGEFDRAAAALTRARAAEPGDAQVARLLGLTWLNLEVYDKAAEALGADPGREGDPSLQYAYGLALVRGGRAAEAEAAFAKLLARHPDSAEVLVVMGQAHARQGDYAKALDALTRAVRIAPGVAEANATLADIYLRQGRVPEAEAAARAELAARPGDPRTQHQLAVILDMAGRPAEAEPLLRAALGAREGFAEAHYLLGRILLARGEAAESAAHLEAAARLDPDDASVRYQLGQAYVKLGRAADAEKEFERFRAAKDKGRVE